MKLGEIVSVLAPKTEVGIYDTQDRTVFEGEIEKFCSRNYENKTVVAVFVVNNIINVHLEIHIKGEKKICLR